MGKVSPCSPSSLWSCRGWLSAGPHSEFVTRSHIAARTSRPQGFSWKQNGTQNVHACHTLICEQLLRGANLCQLMPEAREKLSPWPGLVSFSNSISLSLQGVFLSVHFLVLRKVLFIYFGVFMTARLVFRWYISSELTYFSVLKIPCSNKYNTCPPKLFCEACAFY